MGKNKCIYYICKYNVYVIFFEMKFLILYRGFSFNLVNLRIIVSYLKEFIKYIVLNIFCRSV